MATCFVIWRHSVKYFLLPSSYAFLTPNMPGMVPVRGFEGKESQGHRMKYHGSASACPVAPYKISSRVFCPRCHDQIIAATHSQHVSTTEIHHWWACESCGFEFRTTVRWPRSFGDAEPPSDDPDPLPSERDTLPIWNIPHNLRNG
jgi:predicted RNA-binding Zn-ribbon protein involved in translation (DUF1610 family)